MAPLVVILAGGEGARIGGRKPLRRLGRERLIDHALRLAGRWSDDVRVAVRSPAQVAGLEAPYLIDDSDIEGPLAGLASGLVAARDAGRGWLLTIPCDAPFLPRDFAARMQGAERSGLAVMAQSGSDRHPTCCLWEVSALDSLEAYLSTGRRSLNGFAERVGVTTVGFAPEDFANINTLEDLNEARRRLR